MVGSVAALQLQELWFTPEHGLMSLCRFTGSQVLTKNIPVELAMLNCPCRM